MSQRGLTIFENGFFVLDIKTREYSEKKENIYYILKPPSFYFAIKRKVVMYRYITKSENEGYYLSLKKTSK